MWRPRWKHVRAVSLAAGAFVVAVAITAPVGQFFIAWATQHHFYDNPDKTVTDVLSWLHAVTSSWWFEWVGGLIVGFAAGAWLDSIFGVRRSAQTAASASASDAESALAEPEAAETQPKSLAELFRQDFSAGRLMGTLTLRYGTGPPIGIPVHVCTETEMRAEFYALYFPRTDHLSELIGHALKEMSKLVGDLKNNYGMTTSRPGEFEAQSTADLTFTGRVFIYHEGDLKHREVAALQLEAEKAGYFLVFRGHSYWAANLTK
jgi:hypothetical protein